MSPWVSYHIPPPMRKRIPESLHCPHRRQGYSHLHLALSKWPYSLLRQVLQLQVVHLQLSPQMQIPPRREDRDQLSMGLRLQILLGMGVGVGVGE